jgi:hypothetical protein
MTITVTHTSGALYRVVVEERGTRTTHDVTVTPEAAARYAPAGTAVERLLEASFGFLLERESKESILSTFDLPVIERYFPEYPGVIRQALKS